MLSNMSVAEKNSVSTKRRFRRRVFVMGLLGWLRRRKRGSRGTSPVKKRVVSALRVELHGRC